ncbi:hypothetical protein QIS99_28700 [Streptomyces sp. B-S-A8]|uniref:Uncharacterized protein n=1 Tax=Streptomyces solicavernae TaxID=3043614 RepID=A0ABT6S0B9_9ACTN|nr:hypothetical protein [Streptomyces sp. B-S-A8]MDI3390140.1 hypothetical protein [Streptomyces sp. B-S-A8]
MAGKKTRRSRERHSGGSLLGGAGRLPWGRGEDSGGKAFDTQMSSEVRILMEEGEIVPRRDDSPSHRAQLAYLKTHKGGTAAMEEAGVKRRTARNWFRKRNPATPTDENKERINRAYWQLKARNWARTGTRLPQKVRASVEGQVLERARGQRMSVIPVDHRDVRPQAQGAQKRATERTYRPSEQAWTKLVGSWAADDEVDMDTAWMDNAGDLGSPPELYYEVGHVGFSL